ncbi:uncharacterized protein LOC108677766 isoform X2 [Hyalella azteca]|uniref:Uncharacterized protein LOC108677766 isoform X2 n=1 Tax=Hyalella azteca TaxID=294128 RepID=A0A8B7P8M9_HYAAZ|nr:uncharacterized protein LOC108677766 isoform X2 [Hyalella azteca]
MRMLTESIQYLLKLRAFNWKIQERLKKSSPEKFFECKEQLCYLYPCAFQIIIHDTCVSSIVLIIVQRLRFQHSTVKLFCQKFTLPTTQHHMFGERVRQQEILNIQDNMDIEENTDKNQIPAAVEISEVVATIEGSEVPATVEGSEVATTVRGSEVAATVEGSEVAATVEGSAAAATVEGYEVAVTVEGSEDSATVEGSEVAATVEGSEVAATAEGSEVAETVCAGLSKIAAASSDDSAHSEDRLVLPSLIDGIHKSEGGAMTALSKSEGKYKRKHGKSGSSFTEPNYFVGIPVSNPKIHERVLALQQKMLSTEPLLQSYLTDVATMHLTLFVFNLEDEQLDSARMCLTQLGDKLKTDEGCPHIVLNFKHLGNFRNRKPGKKHLHKIPRESYADYIDAEFGVQTVMKVQLLSMRAPKDANRYYKCEQTLHLLPDEQENHSGCCFRQDTNFLPAESTSTGLST